jgi:hypothetical protein
MDSEQAWERVLIGRRERMRKALAGCDRVTPLEAYVALGFAAEGYETRAAEAVCGTLAGLGFTPYGDAWVRPQD